LNKIETKKASQNKLIENYENQKNQMLKLGYEEHVNTISILKANLMVFITAGPFAIIIISIYLALWKSIIFEINFSHLIILLAIFISIPIHEFIHGFTWHFFCNKKWKSIHFGVLWKALTPYCHCKEPLNFNQYILGGLMPFLTLGLVISLIAIISGSSLILFIGLFNILVSGGDTTIAYKLLKHRKSKIIDHPTKCGFIAFAKKV
jgi:hypothetical protein